VTGSDAGGPPVRAVCFDVDFTLIHPGPTFQGEGYERFCAAFGITVDPVRFDAAVASASSVLDRCQQSIYDPQIFIDYTAHVIERMGGSGPMVGRCATRIYEEWAACHHFSLYEDVPVVLRRLHASGLRIGLISNTHRCLSSFQTHFALGGLIAAAVSSSEHGYMKPHPSIFEAALRQLGVAPHEAMMVGDSLSQDIAGARRLGMQAVLVCRSGALPPVAGDVPIIRSLTELPPRLGL
jgi:putative hydrolase of the HAD superfamily